MLVTRIICLPAPQGHGILVFEKIQTQIELKPVDVSNSVPKNKPTIPPSYATSSKLGVSKIFLQMIR